MTKPSTLYDEDFVRWTAAQAALLRHAKTAGVNAPTERIRARAAGGFTAEEVLGDWFPEAAG